VSRELPTACFLFLYCAMQVHAQSLTPRSAIALQWNWEQQHADASGQHQAHWLPDSHELIFSRTIGSHSRIVRLSADTRQATDVAAGLVPVPAPDGQKIAFIRHDTSPPDAWRGPPLEQIWIADRTGKRARHLFTLPQRQRYWQCISLSWALDSSRLLYSACPLQERQLGPAGKSTAAVVRVFPQASASTLHGELHLIDLRTGADTLLVQNRGEIGRSGWSGHSSIWFVHDNGKRADELWSSIEQLDVDTLSRTVLVNDLQHQIFYDPVFNSDASQMLLLLDSRGPAAPYYPIRSDLAIWSASSGAIRYVARDIGNNPDFVWTPDGRGIVFAQGPSTSAQLYVVYPDEAPRKLTSAEGDAAEPTFSPDGRLLVWRQRPIGQAAELRIARWEHDELHDVRRLIGLEDVPAVAGRWTALQWVSPDGTPVDGLLQLPLEASGGPHPLAVIVHGGPQDKLDPLAGEWPGGQYFLQMLLQRDFAVFLPDYRSSGAAGFAAIGAMSGSREALSADFADINAGIELLIERGIADPKRLVLLGHSWGGTEVNWALTHSRRFAAAVSYEGGDLLLGWGSWRGPDSSVEWYVGKSPVDNWLHWAANSALAHVQGVTTPTLFVSCGRGVSPASMEWLYSAWLRQNVPTQLVVYPDEPHVVASSAARLDLLERILGWLDKHPTVR